MKKLFLPTLLAVLTGSALAQPAADLKNKAYIDDDDQRALADLTFHVDPDSQQNLRIGISAVGPHVEPIGGYRGVQGSNRYTAEELGLLLDGTHTVQVVTNYVGGPIVTGDILEGRYGTLPERRLLADGRIDFLARTAWEYPLEIVVNPQTSASGLRNTFVYVNGQARLRCRYRIVDGRLQDLDVQSLGHDGFLAARPAPAPGAGQLRPRLVSDEAPALTLPDDWEQRDVEGKWAWYANDVLQDPSHALLWPHTLRDAGDFELLEMLALYTPDAFKSHGVIEQLYQAEAPQWIRVAAWHTNGPPNFGHGLQQATSYITKVAPGLTEDWIDDHQEQLDNYESSLSAAYDMLLTDKVPRGDASDFLPPLQREDVFRHLKLDTAVVGLGDRLTAEPGVVYRQQVIRAIQAVPISGRRDAELLQRLRLMTKHADRQVRQAAYLSHTYLMRSMKPTQTFDDFLETIHNQQEHFTVREAAVMAFSYHRHPSVLLTLHDIAADPDHVCWNAAVSRLGDLGEALSITLLEPLLTAERSPAQQKLLRDSLQRLRARAQKSGPPDSRDMVRRICAVAFAQQATHPLADTLRAWVLQEGRRMTHDEWTALQQKAWSTHGQIWIPGTAEDFAARFSQLQHAIVAPQAPQTAPADEASPAGTDQR